MKRIKLATEETKLVAGPSKPEASHRKLTPERRKLALPRLKLVSGRREARKL